MMRFVRNLLLYIVLFLPAVFWAQADSVWSATVGSFGHEDLVRMTRDNVGNVWSVGTTWSDWEKGSQVLILQSDSMLNCLHGLDWGDEGAQYGKDILCDDENNIWILASGTSNTSLGYDPTIVKFNANAEVISTLELQIPGWQEVSQLGLHEQDWLVAGVNWNGDLMQQAGFVLGQVGSNNYQWIELPIAGRDMEAAILEWDTVASSWMLAYHYWTDVDSLPNTAFFWVDTQGNVQQSITNHPLCKGIEMWDAVNHNGVWTGAGGYLENGVFRGHLMYWDFNGTLSNAAAFPATPTESILHSIALKGEGDGYVVAGWTYYFGSGYADAYIHGLDFNMTWLGGGAIGGAQVDKIYDVQAFSRNTLMMVGENASQEGGLDAQGWILKFNDDYITTSDLPIETQSMSCFSAAVGTLDHTIVNQLVLTQTHNAWFFSTELSSLKLFNLQGQLLEEHHGRISSLDFGHLPKGMYLIATGTAQGESMVFKSILD